MSVEEDLRGLQEYTGLETKLDLGGSEADSCHEGWMEKMIFVFVTQLYIFYSLGYLNYLFKFNIIESQPYDGF